MKLGDRSKTFCTILGTQSPPILVVVIKMVRDSALM